jgi:tetratricopeptide (TPR) repeat protein
MFYYGEGRFDDAFLEFSEVVRIQPISEMAYFKMGTIKLSVGDSKKEAGDLSAAGANYQEALGFLQKAIDINPNFADASYNLGLAYLKLDNREGAKKQWLHTLVLKPDHPRALYNLGQLLNLMGDKKGSAEKLCKFMGLGLKEFAAEMETARKVVSAGGGCP